MKNNKVTINDLLDRMNPTSIYEVLFDMYEVENGVLEDKKDIEIADLLHRGLKRIGISYEQMEKLNRKNA